MTTALGTLLCGRLGCSRRRHVSGEGRVVYKFCLAHTLERLTAAFAA